MQYSSVRSHVSKPRTHLNIENNSSVHVQEDMMSSYSRGAIEVQYVMSSYSRGAIQANEISPS